MKLQDGYEKVKLLIGKTIPCEENKNNKGKFGHSLEKWVGLEVGSHHLDFEDGELKTATIVNGKIKEDFKIAKKKNWDKAYLEEKLARILLVIRDSDDKIYSVSIISPLDNLIYKKYFDIEYQKIIDIGLDKVSQKDTVIWVAKTNDTGNKEVNERALYMSAQFLGVLLGLKYSGTKKGGKEIYKEIIEYEQTSSRS